MSQIGRCKHNTLGRLKMAVSAKQDGSTRQSHKGRLETKYLKAIRHRRKDGKQTNQPKIEHRTQNRSNNEATYICK